MIRLGGTAVLALAAWAVLLAGMPDGVAWLCGADGLVSSVPAWDAGRLLSLTVMWAAMMAAMLAPCELVRRALSEGHHPHPASPPSPIKGGGEGAAVPVGWPSPLMGEGARRADEGGAAMLLLALATALLHWALESTALLGTAPLTALLLVALFTIELRKWRRPSTALLPALQMVALQLLVDPMSLSWMAIVLLWMLADLLLPDRPTILSGFQRLRRPSIVRPAAFD